MLNQRRYHRNKTHYRFVCIKNTIRIKLTTTTTSGSFVLLYYITRLYRTVSTSFMYITDGIRHTNKQQICNKRPSHNSVIIGNSILCRSIYLLNGQLFLIAVSPLKHTILNYTSKDILFIYQYAS